MKGGVNATRTWELCYSCERHTGCIRQILQWSPERCFQPGAVRTQVWVGDWACVWITKNMLPGWGNQPTETFFTSFFWTLHTGCMNTCVHSHFTVFFSLQQHTAVQCSRKLTLACLIDKRTVLISIWLFRFEWWHYDTFPVQYLNCYI